MEAKNGEIVVPEIPEIDAPLGKGIDITAAESEVSNALKTLETLGVDTTAANNAYFDFLTAKAETKAEKLNNAFSAINTTIDNAIAQQQAAGIDTSALTALKAQLESALSGARNIITLQTVIPAPQITTQAETIVSALQTLPPTIKAKIGYDGVFNALLSAQMNGSNVELAQAALEMDGLEKLENIDTDYWVGKQLKTKGFTSPVYIREPLTKRKLLPLYIYREV